MSLIQRICRCKFSDFDYKPLRGVRMINVRSPRPSLIVKNNNFLLTTSYIDMMLISIHDGRFDTSNRYQVISLFRYRNKRNTFLRSSYCNYILLLTASFGISVSKNSVKYLSILLKSSDCV